jgi:hypothetical protein
MEVTAMYDVYTPVAFLFLLTMLWVLLAIAVYVLSSLGLYAIAKNRGMENPWLAWIPIAQYYVIGTVVKELDFGSFQIPKMELILPLGALAVAVLSWIPVLSWLLWLAFAVIAIYSLYILYKKYAPNQALIYTILFFLFPIFIFVIRNNNPVE